ncbi:MAG: hypothetical protein IT319_06185 [Anaerolineae bacterium]|nr:hypothetical protein [Anaerolineae bacterium]
MRSGSLTPKTDFIVRWVAGTLLGCLFIPVIYLVIGTMWEFSISIVSARFQAEPWYDGLIDILGSLLAPLIVFVIGAVIGFGQWLLALQNLLRAWVWVLTSAVNGIVVLYALVAANRFAPSLFLPTPSIASGFGSRFEFSETWFTVALFIGITCGVASGMSQWIVLRRYVERASLWLLAVMIGSIGIVGVFVTLARVVKNVVSVEALSCCVSPVAYGLITGGVFYSLLKHRKHKRDDR